MYYISAVNIRPVLCVKKLMAYFENVMPVMVGFAVIKITMEWNVLCQFPARASETFLSTMDSAVSPPINRR